MIKPYKGHFHTEWYPKLASSSTSCWEMNDLTYLDANGYLISAIDGADLNPIGLVQKVTTSTDSDYASATMVPVLVGDEDAEYLCDVTTGTAAQEDVGQWIDIDDENSVDVDASTYQLFFVTKVISATQVVAKMSKNDPRPASIVD